MTVTGLISAGKSRPDRYVARSAFVMLVLNLLFLTLAGCSTWQVPPKYDTAKLQDRAVTQEVKGVRVNAAVLSSDDSLQMFGVNINKTGVQPIWIEVENPSQQMLWLLRSGTDPDIFSPLEVAWSFHTTFGGETNTRLDNHFDAMGFKNPIAPGSTQSGIIFTNPHQQTKFLNVDLLGNGQIFPFTVFPPIPDDPPDRDLAAIVERFANTDIENYQQAGPLRTRLKQLPCCSTRLDTTESGDPLNIVVIGEFADIIAAFVRRGFRKIELDIDNEQILFGRTPDIVVRKSGQGGVPATWVRMWLAPFRFQNQLVFLAQAARPVGGRFTTTETKDLVLHPNVDEVRNYLIQDILYSGGLGKLAYTTGAGAVGPKIVRDSLNGKGYYTDGLRAVMFLVTRPRALSDVEILDWVPYLKQREHDATKENDNGENK